jgi:hypothetical protein
LGDSCPNALFGTFDPATKQFNNNAAQWLVAKGETVRQSVWSPDIPDPNQKNINVGSGQLLLHLDKDGTYPGGAGSSVTPRLKTEPRFNEGTYAARVLVDQIAIPSQITGDPVVETFYIQSPSIFSGTPKPPGSYGEVDFEYYLAPSVRLQFNSWDCEPAEEPNAKLPCQPQPPFQSLGPLPIGWLTFVMKVTAGSQGGVDFFVVDDSGEAIQRASLAPPYVPESNSKMGIFFQVWAENAAKMTADHNLLVDWVLHLPKRVDLSPKEVWELGKASSGLRVDSAP